MNPTATDSTDLEWEEFEKLEKYFLHASPNSGIALIQLVYLIRNGYRNITNLVTLVSMDNREGIRYGRFKILPDGQKSCQGHEFNAKWQSTTFIVFFTFSFMADG